jgi:hypothetical protein
VPVVMRSQVVVTMSMIMGLPGVTVGDVVGVILAAFMRVAVLMDMLVTVLVHVLVAVHQGAVAMLMLVPVHVLVRVNVPMLFAGHVRLRATFPQDTSAPAAVKGRRRKVD